MRRQLTVYTEVFEPVKWRVNTAFLRVNRTLELDL